MTQEAIREIIRRQREFFYTGATLNIEKASGLHPGTSGAD